MNVESSESKARAQGERQRAAEETRNRRRGQLEIARASASKLQQQLSQINGVSARHIALSSHLGGFYEEVDKLTKGKSLLEVTDLIVTRMNEIIGDAKAMVSEDTYLDRVKEFVPAGDNPVYPDVLMTARAVRDCLDRFGERTKADRERVSSKLNEAWTIQVALQLHHEGTANPTKEAVEERLGRSVPSGWFPYDSRTQRYYFDFADLDQHNMEQYLSVHTTVVNAK